MSDQLQQLDALALATDTVLQREGFVTNACIVGTRVVLDAARRADVPGTGYPLMVRAHAINPQLVAWVERHGRLPRDQAESDEATRAGCWVVSIAQPGDALPDERRGLSGHLVAVWRGVSGEAVLLDTTPSQFARPDKGIAPPRVVAANVSPDFLRGAAAVQLALEGGGLLVWQAQPRRRDFTTTTDWFYRPDTRAKLVRLVLREAGL